MPAAPSRFLQRQLSTSRSATCSIPKSTSREHRVLLKLLIRESERNWDLDLAEDVKGEVESKYGIVRRIKVDKMSAVSLYCSAFARLCGLMATRVMYISNLKMSILPKLLQRV